MDRLEILVGTPESQTADGVLCVLNTCLPGGTDLKNTLKNDGIFLQSNEKEEISAENVKTQRYLWTAGPAWQDGSTGTIRALREAYCALLAAAETAGLETVDLLAVPTSVYDSRLFQIATTTLQTLRAFQQNHEMPKTVRILCADDREAMTYKQAYNFWFADTKANRMDYPGWD